jgi:hypothetical protein
MAFDIGVSRFMDFVQLTVRGPCSIGGFVDLVRTVERESHLWSDRKVLVDLREIDGELSSDEQVFLGELVAQHFGHLERVASLVPAGQRTGNSENAAQGMGMQLRVFVSKDEAVGWLQGATLEVRSPA